MVNNMVPGEMFVKKRKRKLDDAAIPNASNVTRYITGQKQDRKKIKKLKKQKIEDFFIIKKFLPICEEFLLKNHQHLFLHLFNGKATDSLNKNISPLDGEKNDNLEDNTKGKRRRKKTNASSKEKKKHIAGEEDTKADTVADVVSNTVADVESNTRANIERGSTPPKSFNLYENYVNASQKTLREIDLPFDRAVLLDAIDRSNNTNKIIKIINKKKVLSAFGESWEYMMEYIISLNGHKNLLKIYDIYDDDKNFYIIMEKLNGKELFSFLVYKKQVKECICKYIISQILQAVSYLHNHNIIHRDIKPENLMFRNKKRRDQTYEYNYELVLIDYDTCQLLGGDAGFGLGLGTGFGAVVGPMIPRIPPSPEHPGQHNILQTSLLTNGKQDEDPNGNNTPSERAKLCRQGLQRQAKEVNECEFRQNKQEYCGEGTETGKGNLVLTPHKQGSKGNKEKKQIKLVGTYGYIAPEIIKGFSYSTLSDMWSIGIIFYILMTGITPLPMCLMINYKNTKDILLKKEKKGINFNLLSFSNYPLAKDLCERFLQFDTQKRIQNGTIASNHPWLKYFNILKKSITDFTLQRENGNQCLPPPNEVINYEFGKAPKGKNAVGGLAKGRLYAEGSGDAIRNAFEGTSFKGNAFEGSSQSVYSPAELLPLSHLHLPNGYYETWHDKKYVNAIIPHYNDANYHYPIKGRRYIHGMQSSVTTHCAVGSGVTHCASFNGNTYEYNEETHADYENEQTPNTSSCSPCGGNTPKRSHVAVECPLRNCVRTQHIDHPLYLAKKINEHDTDTNNTNFTNVCTTLYPVIAKYEGNEQEETTSRINEEIQMDIDKGVTNLMYVHSDEMTNYGANNFIQLFEKLIEKKKKNFLASGISISQFPARCSGGIGNNEDDRKSSTEGRKKKRNSYTREGRGIVNNRSKGRNYNNRGDSAIAPLEERSMWNPAQNNKMTCAPEEINIFQTPVKMGESLGFSCDGQISSNGDYNFGGSVGVNHMHDGSTEGYLHDGNGRWCRRRGRHNETCFERSVQQNLHKSYEETNLYGFYINSNLEEKENYSNINHNSTQYSFFIDNTIGTYSQNNVHNNNIESNGRNYNMHGSNLNNVLPACSGINNNDGKNPLTLYNNSIQNRNNFLCDNFLTNTESCDSSFVHPRCRYTFPNASNNNCTIANNPNFSHMEKLHKEINKYVGEYCNEVEEDFLTNPPMHHIPPLLNDYEKNAKKKKRKKICAY
ncbi:calcium/calmodulin-dependent protein kinase, putative [Plasmodium ovale curtisi]|uniref:Calcium/calmodulin-dependent protein kinase, putative n=2 Tax=Plasmodium ovale TaxID=36330 RepID=A0A1A8VVC2_PLAOA|nr:calcium/calmodulin-dependent protein kinase, putative [Plasmodium ovale curtisi]